MGIRKHFRYFFQYFGKLFAIHPRTSPPFMFETQFNGFARDDQISNKQAGISSPPALIAQFFDLDDHTVQMPDRNVVSVFQILDAD